MRQVVFAVAACLGLGLPAFGADAAPKLSVEIRADNEAKYATVAAVLSAVRKSEGVPAHVALRVEKADGVSAVIRVSPEVPYADLFGLLDALKKAGVGKIDLIVK
jgi:biopolymer transport protein ExbD